MSDLIYLGSEYIEKTKFLVFEDTLGNIIRKPEYYFSLNDENINIYNTEL